MGHLRPPSPTTSIPALAVETCAGRLRALGAEDLLAGAGCPISWHGPADLPLPATEATVQARCGLMEVNGRDQGTPRRLGVDVASVAAGMLAAQATLAGGIARARGGPAPVVTTSVLQAGLVLLSHYFVVATSLGDAVPGPPLPAPGPPFRSADGRWFEIETLDPGAWKALWERLGAGNADLGRGWTVFRWRYERAACSLPTGLHEAAGRHSLEALREACAACGVSLVALRACDGGHVGRGAGPSPELRPLEPAGPGRRRPEPPADALPLAGLRVVEATSRIQGPFAGMLLRMLGAEVVRVQPPEGDYGRAAACLHRAKDVVRLDLGRPADRAELVDLVAGADAFLHNWRPGRADGWGLGPEQLASSSPGLVYAAASGWGSDQPTSPLLGTDFLVQAHAGLGCLLNPDGEPPFPSRVVLTDLFGALVGAEGVLAGLYRRSTTGRGWAVETSLLAGAMSLRAPVPGAWAASAKDARPGGRPSWGPLDRPVPTVDGALVVSADEDEPFRRLCLACAVDPLAAPRGVTEAEVAARLGAGRAAEWEPLLAGAGVPTATVASSLAAVAGDRRLAPLFEPVGGGVAPRTPWDLR